VGSANDCEYVTLTTSHAEGWGTSLARPFVRRGGVCAILKFRHYRQVAPAAVALRAVNGRWHGLLAAVFVRLSRHVAASCSPDCQLCFLSAAPPARRLLRDTPRKTTSRPPLTPLHSSTQTCDLELHGAPVSIHVTISPSSVRSTGKRRHSYGDFDDDGKSLGAAIGRAAICAADAYMVMLASCFAGLRFCSCFALDRLFRNVWSSCGSRSSHFPFSYAFGGG